MKRSILGVVACACFRSPNVRVPTFVLLAALSCGASPITYTFAGVGSGSLVPTVSFNITGAGSGSFVNGSVFANSAASFPVPVATVGFGQRAAVLNSGNSAFDGYNLKMPIGPIAANQTPRGSAEYHFSTDAGTLIFNSFSSVGFTAAATSYVPKPSSLLLSCPAPTALLVSLARQRRRRPRTLAALELEL